MTAIGLPLNQCLKVCLGSWPRMNWCPLSLTCFRIPNKSGFGNQSAQYWSIRELKRLTTTKNERYGHHLAYNTFRRYCDRKGNVKLEIRVISKHKGAACWKPKKCRVYIYRDRRGAPHERDAFHGFHKSVHRLPFSKSRPVNWPQSMNQPLVLWVQTNAFHRFDLWSKDVRKWILQECCNKNRQMPKVHENTNIITWINNMPLQNYNAWQWKAADLKEHPGEVTRFATGCCASQPEGFALPMISTKNMRQWVTFSYFQMQITGVCFITIGSFDHP